MNIGIGGVEIGKLVEQTLVEYWPTHEWERFSFRCWPFKTAMH